MPSSHTHRYGYTLEPCKLSFMFSALILTLPSLFASLIIFSFVAFLLFCPIAFTLFTIHLLSCILSRFPISIDEVGLSKVESNEDQEQECIELDGSEIPRLDESSSSGSSTEEQEKIVKELEQIDHEEFRRFLEQFGSVESDGFMSFFEVLSFWRSKESSTWVNRHQE